MPVHSRFSLLTLPSQPSAFLRATTDDHANPNCPIKLAHGTTTLAFRFQGGIIVATDSRATAGNWIASQTVKKVIEINSTLLGTMAGGAAVSLENHCPSYASFLTSLNHILTHPLIDPVPNRTANIGSHTSGSNVAYTSSDTNVAYRSPPPPRFLQT